MSRLTANAFTNGIHLALKREKQEKGKTDLLDFLDYFLSVENVAFKSLLTVSKREAIRRLRPWFSFWFEY